MTRRISLDTATAAGGQACERIESAYQTSWKKRQLIIIQHQTIRNIKLPKSQTHWEPKPTFELKRRKEFKPLPPPQQGLKDNATWRIGGGNAGECDDSWGQRRVEQGPDAKDLPRRRRSAQRRCLKVIAGN